MTRIYLLTVFCLAVSFIPALSDVVVEYDGLAGTTQPGVTGANVALALDLSRGAGVTASTGSTFNSRGFEGTSLSEAITNDDFLSFGFTPAAGFMFDLMDIQVELDRSASGPTTVELLSSIGGFTDSASLGAFAVPDPAAILNFSVSSLTGISTATEFRLYAYGASSSTGTMDIEPISIGGGSGNVGLQVNGTGVPEPSAFACLALIPGFVFLRFGFRRFLGRRS